MRENYWTDVKVWFLPISSSGFKVKIWLNSIGPPYWAFKFAVMTAARRVYLATCWASVQIITILRLLQQRRRPIWPATEQQAIHRFINFHRIRTNNNCNNNNNNNRQIKSHTFHNRITLRYLPVGWMVYLQLSNRPRAKTNLLAGAAAALLL